MSQAETVFVGLSGGVDSAVAALRLQRQGYRVVGVFIKVWHPDFLVCNWEQERLDAMRVAAHLDIPFLTCDSEVAYRDAVAAYFIAEYRAGRTPNPDVLCNQHVKFGAFLDFARTQGADRIATGHYAQRLSGPEGPELHRGVDAEKDQTYFLWSLTPTQLAHALFPVGDTPKATIRAEADAAGIPTATKKDSQGICFLGHVDIPEFLSHYITLETGAVLDRSGHTIGHHQGALTYTLGQRHGFTITTQDTARPAMYVIDRDIHANTITVDTEPPHHPPYAALTLETPVLRKPLTSGDELSAQFRYRQPPMAVAVTTVAEHSLTIEPLVPIDRPAAGQSCVLYRGTECIGGGIIA
jgi:tRNA-specific 2-thiouridylase